LRFDLEIKCKKIVGGRAKGKLLLSKKPINFLGMVNTQSGEITTTSNDVERQNLKGKILVFPNSIGSSVGAYTIYSLKSNNVAPNGIICTNNVDITTASGCAISNIPLAFIDNQRYNDLVNCIKILGKNKDMEITLDTAEEKVIIE
jgi:predicted aconitase with swiveling domain